MDALLRQPYLPQMNDGVITQGDLESDNTIYVLIRPYSSVTVDDFIVLHFGGLPVRTYLVQDPYAEVVATFTIDADKVPDGTYLVWYEGTDPVGNTSGPSLVAWAVVNRSDEGALDAPVFTDANERHEIDDESVQENDGTHVAVPAYEGIQTGDNVDLFFYVTDADNALIDNSQYAVLLTVQPENVQQGLSTLIPAAYLMVPGGVNCHARYTVSPAGGGRQKISLTGVAILTLNGTDMLPPPSFIDAIYGWLTPEQVTGGIRIQAAWPSIAAGDVVDMLLTGFDVNGSEVPPARASQSRTVSSAEASRGSILFTFDRSSADAVFLGRLNAGYTVAGDRSVVANVNVDMTGRDILPAPDFTQAEGGVIDESAIIAEGGALVSMAYPGMAVGDNVTLYISGRNAEGVNVPEATVVLPVEVSEQHVSDGHIILRVAQNNALAPGDGGTLHAQYTVDFINNMGFGYSFPEEVTLMTTPSSSLALVLATGAPLLDDTLTIRPHNNGKLYGPAGARIDLSCSAPAVFTEVEANTMTVTLNQNGEARFSVQSTATGGITVQAVDEITSQQISGVTTFNRYRAGSTPQIHSWGNSTGSAADNTMACSIYVVTKDLPTVTRIHAQVIQGEATLLETGEQSGDLLLNPDKSVVIDFVDTQAEDVLVRISLPESSGNTFEIPLHFVK
jgi:hypothetical protein